MTRQDAERLVQTLGRTFGVETALNPTGFGGISVGESSLYFEFDEKAQTLECSALIYKFHDAPKPGIIEGFKAEEAAGTDTGGGKVDYEPENKGLFLSKTYSKTPDVAGFEKDMERLMEASRVWGDDVLDRVSTKVFHGDKK
jgi:hypothetical protein